MLELSEFILSQGYPVVFSPKLVVALVLSVGLAGCSSMSPSSVFEKASRASVESYSELGIKYLQAGDTQSAKSALVQALDINPKHAPSLNGLALVFQTEAENDLAENYFRDAVSADPSSAMIHNNFGAFLYAQKRYDEACVELARATEDPFYSQRAQAFENLGRCYRLIGRNDAAIFMLQRALTLSPDRPLAMVEIADLYIEQGDYDAASEWFLSFRDLVDRGQVDHFAKSLWVGVRLARIQGKASRAATYSLLLKNLYPESEEYKKYKESGR